jgi:hypothetical protein
MILVGFIFPRLAFFYIFIDSGVRCFLSIKTKAKVQVEKLEKNEKNKRLS